MATPQIDAWSMRKRVPLGIWLATCLWIFLTVPALGSDPPLDRLLDHTPYDEIQLGASGDNALLQVRLLDLPGRRAPEKIPTSGRFELELIDNPGQRYELAWEHVTGLKLWEQLLLEEAQKFSSQGHFDRAYDNFAYLMREQPELPGLRRAIEDFLFQDATAAYKREDFELALARLLEVVQYNPRHENLTTTTSQVADKLIERHLSENNLVAARALVDLLKRTFPNNSVPAVAQWEKKFSERANQALARAQRHLEEQEYRQARKLVSEALSIWPALPAAHQMINQIDAIFFQVVVGVTWPYSEHSSQEPESWAWRRTRRLISRPLVEPGGVDGQGIRYTCPLGEIQEGISGRQILLSIRPEQRSARGAPITGLEISRRLLTRTSSDPRLAGWQELCAGVGVPSPYSVAIDLRHPHVRAAAFLQIGLSEPGNASRPLGFGPYQELAGDREETVFKLSDSYSLREVGQPQEIIEVPCPSMNEAIAALRRGDLRLLERVPPWDLPRLREIKEIALARYACPSIHVLIPNPRHPLLANRTFRRALEYAIDRQAILNQEILVGQPGEGSAVLSGPFPSATSLNDPLGYASDDRIEPRPHEPYLARALALSALKEWMADEKQPEGGPAPPFPPLTLAYPAEPVARQACHAIAEQLHRIGLEIVLKEFSAVTTSSDTLPPHDLLYAEWSVWEPMADVRPLLAKGPLPLSPYLNLAFQELSEAGSSQQIRRKLHEIHALIHGELTVIPLWQIVEHCAYHRSLEGIGQRPVSLYQNVEQWRLSRPESP